MGNIAIVNSGNMKLSSNTDTPYLDSLVAALVIGILGGLLGSLFIVINNKVNILRKKLLTNKVKKVIEACVLVAITVTVFYICSYLRNSCIEGTPDDFLISKGIKTKRFTCPEGYYNRLATLLFDS
jgi:chloride channel 7